MTSRISRRGFLGRSAAVGALSVAGYRPGEAAAISQANEDALVAPQYRGFLKKSVNDLPTPALLIDLDIMERNLQALATYMKGKPATFRPHAKAHKSPAIGKLQIASGARGLCAAKLGEADVLVRGGIRDVLITAEVVGTLKIKRLMDLLAITPNVKAVVDNEQNAMDLSAAALAAKKTLGVLIDVNVGQNRTGVDPADAEKLAQAIGKLKGLQLLGVQGYGGNNQHVVGYDARKAR
jgi:D-serine deaminase-like pyridoxal phosphate-dependent protein